MRVTRSNISKKIYRLKDFRGVDYSSSPLEVQPYRSTDMANFILRDGVLHKRNGWERMLKVAVTEGLGKVLNVWRFDSTTLIVRMQEYYKTSDSTGAELKERSVYYLWVPNKGTFKKLTMDEYAIRFAHVALFGKIFFSYLGIKHIIHRPF